jgi:hypothetical protein
VAEAGPGPVLRDLYEAAFDGVVVDVMEDVHGGVVEDEVAVMVAGEPEGVLWGAFGDGKLERLEGGGEGLFFGFGEEEVDVLGHEDVAEEVELITEAGLFEGVEEEGLGLWGVR